MNQEPLTGAGKICLRESSDACFIVSLSDRRILEVNPESEKMTGFTQEELSARKIDEILHSNRESGLDELLPGFARNCPTRLEGCWLQGKDSGRIPVSVTFSSVSNPSEGLGLFTARDLSRVERAERALQQARRLQEATNRVLRKIVEARDLADLRQIKNLIVSELQELGIPVGQMTVRLPSLRLGHYLDMEWVDRANSPQPDHRLSDSPWVQEAWNSGQPVVVHREQLGKLAAASPPIQSLVEIPLPGIGSLSVSSSSPEAFSPQAIESLLTFSILVADALRRSLDFKRLGGNFERLSILVNQSSDGIHISEVDRFDYPQRRQVIFFNDPFVKMSGRTVEELLEANNLNDYIVDHSSPGKPSNGLSVLKRRGSQKGVSSWKRQDGKENFFEWLQVPFEAKGKLYVMSIDRDITVTKLREREKTELEHTIERAKNEWEATVDAMPELVALVDLQCYLLRCNEALRLALDKPWKEILGWPLHDLLFKAHAPMLSRAFQRVIQSRKQELLELYDPRRKGYFRVGIAPVADSKGKLIAIVETIQDITESRLLEEMWKRYEFIVNTSKEFLSLVDANYTYVAVNDAFCSAHQSPRDKLIGKFIREVWGEETFNTIIKEHLDRCFKGADVHYQAEFMFPGLGTRSFEVSYYPYKNKQGKVTHAVVVSRDVTERKRTEEALRQSEEQLRHSQRMEAVGRLAGGIAHDFNNLLTVIRGFSDIVIHKMHEKDPLRSQVEKINRAAERASILTRQLLAFSRKQMLQPAVIDLNKVILETEKVLRPLIGEDIELIIKTESKEGRVQVDPVQIEQVIMNLAINSRDAMEKGGKLILECMNMELDEAYRQQHDTVQPGHYMMLAVSDTGCGMDEETQSHLFEPFFTTKEPGKGTGLGLATVYGIVKQSGGYIWVYSQEGQGTTFKIYLPRVDVAGEAAASSLTPALELKGTETILLVEDDEMLRDMTATILKSSGYTVLEATDGENGLSVSRGHKGIIHLLLTDVVMPRMSGPEFVENLRPFRLETKVLYMSGYTDHGIVHHGMLTPGIAFLQKPFSSDGLLQKLREILDKPGRVPSPATRQ